LVEVFVALVLVELVALVVSEVLWVRIGVKCIGFLLFLLILVEELGNVQIIAVGPGIRGVITEIVTVWCDDTVEWDEILENIIHAILGIVFEHVEKRHGV
jgi:hypothetical protein